MLPSISSYGHYRSNNYGVNTLRVDIGDLTVWYSYQTPVAFRVLGNELVIRYNSWGQTTGKHLNWIDDDHSKRVDADTFQRLWNEQTGCLV